MTPPRPNTIYQFGPFRLELREHRLLRNGCPISLTGKAFSTLRVLVEAQGALLSKQEIMAAVWPETSVEENNLDRNISTLRKALGDQPSGESFIETVPRVGYRIAAPVSEASAAGSAPPDPAGQPSAMRQEIRFCLTGDKVRLAYACAGSGHPLVKVANCFNHLDFEWEGPIWRHWVRDFASHQTLVRYDGRASGISEWDVDDVSFEAWVRDLETVVDAAGLAQFALLGHSQGGAVAIAYAVRHPERVSHLVLCGAYSRGAHYRAQPEAVEVRHALETLVELNWGKTNPSFFQVVTNLYIPDSGSPDEQRWFAELQIVSVSPANLVRYMQTCDAINVRPLLPSVSVPTLVFHSDRDKIAPPEEGRILAAEIPGAQFVPLPSANHILLEDEPAWQIFRQELSSFLDSRNKRAGHSAG